MRKWEVAKGMEHGAKDREQMTEDPSSLFELRRGTQRKEDFKDRYWLFVIRAGNLIKTANLALKQ